MEIFARGDIVRIKSGPFTNFKGQVEAVHPKRPYLKIVVEIYGRPTPIELKFSEVEKLPPRDASNRTS
jgi:transcription termination/antitermination protein NusG